MRVLMAVQNYFPRNNGQAVFARRLAEGMAQRGHEVAVLTPSLEGPARRDAVNGVTVHSIRSLPLRPLYPGVSVTVAARGQVAEIIDPFRPDLVHVQDHFPLCRAVVRAARRRGIPVVATNHFMPANIIPFVPVLSRYRWSRRRLERVLWRQVVSVFQWGRRVTAPTRTAARMLNAAGLRQPVEAVSNGIDLEVFRPRPVDRRAVLERLGADPDLPTFLFVGRVDREKRLDVALRALPEVPGAGLVVAGEGRDRRRYIALAQRLGVADRAVFPGLVDDLPAVLNSVDVFIMPSEAELQSIATLEAMACARPVVAAAAHALTELVEEGVNGCLFRPGSPEDAARSMRRILQDRDRWTAMGQASLARARAHDHRETVARYEELYTRSIS